MMKKLTILSLTIFLSSCVCWKVKPRVACDVSFQFDRCRCRCLDIQNIATTDPKACGLDWEEPVRDFPIMQCEGITGFYIEDIAKHIKPEAKETLQCAKDKNCLK